MDTTSLSGIIQVIILVTGGVWAVGKIKETTSVLSNAISNLKAAVDKLDTTILSIQETQNDMAVRVAVLEERAR